MYLREWEEGDHGSWVRRNANGEVTLQVFPEGLDESMCWVWQVVPAVSDEESLQRDVNTGSEPTLEAAQKAVEAAAQRFGFMDA